ncbi:MAG TPA: IS4 family transposase [Spirochaeta sp.]|nr:IS4 family transposase [Spirochaeta sp.]
MSHKNSILNQIIQIVPRHEFEKSVKKYKGDFASKGFTCWEQFVSMLFAQLSGQTGLRGIETALTSIKSMLYHLGVKNIKRSTLSYANNNRPSEIYENVFNNLLAKILKMERTHKHRFKNPLFSIDATTIDLCLSVFPWAKFRKTKGGIKMNVKLDHRGYIPVFVSVTTANKHEVSSVKTMEFQKGDVITFDRGYTDFKQFASYCNAGIYFVTRLKKNADYKVVHRNDVSEYENISSDQIIEMKGFYTSKKCPLQLRRIRSKDPETGKYIVILTNHFDWAPTTISAIYKDRWQIEIFFKTIKQNLKIKKFFGTTRNAVMTQIWIALITHLMLQYLKMLSSGGWTHYTLMKLLPTILTTKKDLWTVLNKLPPPGRKNPGSNFQLELL